jgi:prolipoprotein diacylglyceryltransferase
MASSARNAEALLSDTLQALANRTVLFRRGDLIFVTFGLFAAAGAFAGGLWVAAVLLGMGVSLPEATLLLGGILLGHVVLARAFLIPWRLPDVFRNPGETLRRVEFASWGGFIAIAAGLGAYAALSGRSLLALVDAAALGGVLGHAVGRLGCITFGCCFGRPTASVLAVRYESPLAKAVRVARLQGVPLHPVPLYEAVFNLGLFLLLNAVALGGSREGVPAALYLLAYGTARFFLEFMRWNGIDDYIGPLPRNQWLSIGQAGAGGLLLVALSSVSGPPSPSIAGADARVLGLIPALVATSALVCLAYSLHRRSIGRW